VKGPSGELDVAILNLTLVLAGIVAFHQRVCHVGALHPASKVVLVYLPEA